jgi:putative SOS response-associated peptidase YedK
MLRDLVKSRRCLVPSTGFYEWKKAGRGKVLHYIRMKDNSVFAFAGLYDKWKAPDGKETLTFTIITTEPNPVVAPLHDRMPAILYQEDEEAWLRPGVLKQDWISHMLQPYPAEGMTSFPFSTAVNLPDNEDERLIRPVKVDFSGW